MSSPVYETRTIKVAVTPLGGAIFDERTTIVEIEDEGGGEFVCVSQCNSRAEGGRLSFEADDWPAVRAAVQVMLDQCKEAKQ
ncbi:hypothetical protein [Stieleria sp.]|uniref:hypothetical protein n=1 Tax=Stieleria sp. TaxID=2795976 RepID=UPI00356AD153